MNPLARAFFLSNKDDPPKESLILSERGDLVWDHLVTVCYNLPRGWYELSRIKEKDRVEFTRDFWLDRIPYHPKAHPGIFEFFEVLDDVSPILTRRSSDEPFEAELVYSFRDNSTFFRGKPPCQEGEIQSLNSEINVRLPRDYLSFMKIHNGFGKLSEMGLLEIDDVFETKRRVMDLLIKSERRVKSGDVEVDPNSLIPFYESLGMSCFQCFYLDWYPGNEMGNVYLSGIEYNLSDLKEKKAWTENLAFPTFSEWLTFYLQGMNLCI